MKAQSKQCVPLVLLLRGWLIIFTEGTPRQSRAADSSGAQVLQPQAGSMGARRVVQAVVCLGSVAPAATRTQSRGDMQVPEGGASSSARGQDKFGPGGWPAAHFFKYFESQYTRILEGIPF